MHPGAIEARMTGSSRCRNPFTSDMSIFRLLVASCLLPTALTSQAALSSSRMELTPVPVRTVRIIVGSDGR